jgi:hypothetical protein
MHLLMAELAAGGRTVSLGCSILNRAPVSSLAFFSALLVFSEMVRKDEKGDKYRTQAVTRNIWQSFGG